MIGKGDGAVVGNWEMEEDEMGGREREERWEPRVRRRLCLLMLNGDL